MGEGGRGGAVDVVFEGVEDGGEKEFDLSGVGAAARGGEGEAGIAGQDVMRDAGERRGG